MMKDLLKVGLLSTAFMLLGVNLQGQVQFNQIEGFGVAIYGINNQGNGVHGNGYYNFATNSSSMAEDDVVDTSAITSSEIVLGRIENSNGDYVAAMRVNGEWIPFPASAPISEGDSLYDISENGEWVVGQTEWDMDADTSWGFIYNTQTEEYTLLSSPEYEFSAAYGVNNEGFAVGWVDDLEFGTYRMPAIFDADGNIYLISEEEGEASGINDEGQIVGGLMGYPFIYDMGEDAIEVFESLDGFFGASFSDISNTGVAIGFGDLPGFSRAPIIYHPDLGGNPLMLKEVLTQFGVPDAEDLVGTAYRISEDGNYVCGWGDGPAFMAPGWAVYFNDQLLFDSECDLICPGNITLDAELGATSVVVEYELTFECEGDGPEGLEIVLVSGLPSGSDFPIGKTSVYHELRDGEGNVLDACSFLVTINDPYCTPSFDMVEPITYVEFAGIENRTSAGFGTPRVEYFLDQEGTVTQGETYEIILEGFTDSFIDYFTVFIDWNQDGDFNDANEYMPIGTLANSNGEDGLQLIGNITVPADATLGKTRMRVVKNWDEDPTNPCGEYGYGQSEDYTLNVEEGMGVRDLSNSDLTYYPNPVQDVLTITSKQNIKEVAVYSLTGQKVMKQAQLNQGQIDVSSLTPGTYVFKVNLDNGTVKTFKVVKK